MPGDLRQPAIDKGPAMCYSLDWFTTVNDCEGRMVDALRVIRFSFRDYWEEFVWLSVLNLLWAVTLILPFAALLALGGMSLPLALVVGLVLAAPLPIVSAGICFVTNQVSRGKTVGWGTFVQGVRRYWAKGLLVAVISLVALILILANVQFYGLVLEGTWTDFALSAWLIVGIYWLLAQIFWFPMILEQEHERVFQALRNALAMVIITPAFSITLGVLLVILGALCLILTVPAVVIMGSLFLLIANHATRSRLAFVKKKPYEPWADLQEEKKEAR
jgi:hypothetical protein